MCGQGLPRVSTHLRCRQRSMLSMLMPRACTQRDPSLLECTGRHWLEKVISISIQFIGTVPSWASPSHCLKLSGPFSRAKGVRPFRSNLAFRSWHMAINTQGKQGCSRSHGSVSLPRLQSCLCPLLAVTVGQTCKIVRQLPVLACQRAVTLQNYRGNNTEQCVQSRGLPGKGDGITHG